MELVTGAMAQLHATDVVMVLNASGHAGSSNFNLAVNKGALGTVRASIEVNGRATDLVMMHDQQAGCFLFPGGKLVPEPQLLLSLPLARGRNRMEFRVLDSASGDRIGAVADLWLWHAGEKVVVVDVDPGVGEEPVAAHVVFVRVTVEQRVDLRGRATPGDDGRRRVDQEGLARAANEHRVARRVSAVVLAHEHAHLLGESSLRFAPVGLHGGEPTRKRIQGRLMGRFVTRLGPRSPREARERQA